jgi:phosphoglycolate phosphatase-like HAD superfamily hydrolase
MDEEAGEAMTTKATVLFAVDGTLVDTGNIYTLTWWEALWQNNHPVSMAQVHQALEKGPDRVIEELVGPRRDPGRDERIKATRQLLFGRYWAAVRPFDAAGELLRACARRGWDVVLAGAVSTRDLAVLCESLGSDTPEYAAAITATISGEQVVPGTRAGDFLQAALDQVGTTSARAVFVGATVRDMRTGKAVGVPCIALATGGAGEDELLEAGATEAYKDAAALLDNLDDSLLGTVREA